MDYPCAICGKESPPVAEILGVCRECIVKNWTRAKPYVKEAHQISREEFGFPQKEELKKRGKSKGAVLCRQCVNQCWIPSGKTGFCGIKENRDGRLFLKAGTRSKGYVDYYYDPLPTNCVASWVCGEREKGDYRKRELFPLRRVHEKNLAVFYQSCTFDCLYCQNWHFRLDIKSPRQLGAEELAQAVDSQTRCVCYFGGDPASQLPHSIATSRQIIKQKGNTVRICWETNGSANPKMMKKAGEIALETGGTIKIDLKAFTPRIHQALTGCSNENTLENLKMLAEMGKQRSDPPLVCASTLLVPGYINNEEVRRIARFIASCDTNIPYSILAFYPAYMFDDIPITSRQHAQKAEEISREQGLTNVHIGNIHLLDHGEYLF